jgi:hypothetical protein
MPASTSCSPAGRCTTSTTLRDAGFDGEKDAARGVQNLVSHLLTILTSGSLQIGYVISGKAR